MEYTDLWDAIERLARSKNLSCSALAKKSGLDATTFNKCKRTGDHKKQRWPSTRSISKILKATDITLEEFAKFVHPSHG